MRTMYRLEGAAAAAIRALQERVGVPVAAAAAEIAREEVVELIRASVPAGETYRAADGSVRRRSAPGQAPAEGEGVYLAAWETTAPVIDGLVVEAAACNAMQTPAGTPLGVDLEFGTEHVAPRPHARPAALSAAPRVAAMVREASAS